MLLTNFELRYPQGVELVGLGHNWDLHNFATLDEVTFDRASATAALSWTADAAENPWGDPSNGSKACRLKFEGVTRWEIDKGHGRGADTLSEISDRPQGSDDWHEADQFDLWIRLEDETMIKVSAANATLHAVTAGT